MTLLHTFHGARVRRVIDPSDTVVAEHAHDWPMLSLFVMGGYRNFTEHGERAIAQPSFVFYRRGEPHRNLVGETGFEQIEIEFDPAWLGHTRLPSEPLLMRVGGRSGAVARALVADCGAALSDDAFRDKIRRMFLIARSETARARPDWVKKVDLILRTDPQRPIAALAADVGISPAWIGAAYRRHAGEGLQQATARYRVERASRLLRETGSALVDIAADTGFCDQSHMNRVFHRVLGRAPTTIRADRDTFRNRH
jgi:AraC family transcriptional regulator